MCVRRGGPRRQRASPEGRRARPSRRPEPPPTRSEGPSNPPHPRGGLLGTSLPPPGGAHRHPHPPGRPLGAGQELASCRGSVGTRPLALKGLLFLCVVSSRWAVICILLFLLLCPHASWGRGREVSPCSSFGKLVSRWQALELEERQPATALVLLPSAFPSPLPHTNTLLLMGLNLVAFISSVDQEGIQAIASKR